MHFFLVSLKEVHLGVLNKENTNKSNYYAKYLQSKNFVLSEIVI